MKESKKMLCAPFMGFVIVVALCILGIILDNTIGNVLATHPGNEMIGRAFAVLGSYLSYCIYPAVGVCLYMGEKNSNEFLGYILLPTTYLIAILFANECHGAKIRYFLSDFTDVPSTWWPLIQFGFWIIMFLWVPLICLKLFDNLDPNKLCFTGVTILGTGLVSEAITVWSRIIPPSLFLEAKGIELLSFLNPFVMMSGWARMFRYTLQNYDSTSVWPDGNMAAVALALSLPLLSDVMKNRSDKRNSLVFVVVFVFGLLYGLNRIQMTERSISDVCLDTLVTYLLFVACGLVAFYTPPYEEKDDKGKT